MKKIFTYAKGELQAESAQVVAEFPLSLTVNGREIATLVASPHELNYLVAGFLRLQGFVDSPDDIELLAVCNDFGAANVRVKGELPERLKPFLTSGCGTGITFSTPQATEVISAKSYTPEQIFTLMDELAKRADRYRSHGGIHAAAVGDGERMLLCAEDIGRHNTLDRIAGEALLKGIDLAGTVLVTTGRISTEMAAKAALLGICLIASRTSPTDMAIKLCEDSGITLVGYLRYGRFQVYSHQQKLLMGNEKIKGIAGVILAGGKSTRMGRNKALLPYNGRPLIESIYRVMSELFEQVAVVTNSPEDYCFLPCVKIPDIHVGKGSLAGIHAGLVWSPEERIFVVGCDMPFLEKELVRRLAALSVGENAVVPSTPGGLEPLHAIYAKRVLPLFDEALNSDLRRIVDLLERIGAKVIPSAEIAAISPQFSSFVNLNTPEEYNALP
ncbi:MAG: formate dehydrogenase family accessory protein FdhD [Deltaproteobacteria bacterium HGW-Deltaproteobacteria-23]|nr:MAG: formate dehydrogenase family accessory protein FdhD [Deltaproteobacteria bacterium HGW-Deltaproteobacteria-23]